MLASTLCEGMRERQKPSVTRVYFPPAFTKLPKEICKRKKLGKKKKLGFWGINHRDITCSWHNWGEYHLYCVLEYVLVFELHMGDSL